MIARVAVVFVRLTLALAGGGALAAGPPPGAVPAEPLVVPARPGSAPVSATDMMASPGDAVRFAPREVLVRFRRSADATDRAQARAEVDGTLTEAWKLVPGLQMVRIPRGESVEAAVSGLEDNPDVLYASPNVIMKTQATPNDPGFGDLWGMSDIRAPAAWNAGTGSRDVPVAVIDTGVEMDHPDLKENIWTNPGEIPNNRIDDDNNGFVDDIHGWDFISNDNSPGYEGEPAGAHGTHVAGTIGAVGDNGIGVVGVNWRSSIMPLTVCTAGGACYLDAVIDALQYAVNKGVRVSNNSYGGPGCAYTPLRDAISAAGTRGHLFVAAAGNAYANNDTDPHCPSSFGLPNIISVAATNSAGQMAAFSNYGDSVDLAAPGVGILSTLPEGGYGTTGGYGRANGTSMATPHVAGAAALLLSLHPDWTVAQVKDRLLESTHPLDVDGNRAPRNGGLDLANAVSGVISDPQLRARLEGTGVGLVEASSVGIRCGDQAGETDCSRTVPRGTTVTLRAQPRYGGSFAGWKGPCSGTGDCTVTVSAVTRVRALFRAPVPSGWDIEPIPAVESRAAPFHPLRDSGSFNGVSLSADGQTRARTIYERDNYCNFWDSRNGVISIDEADGSGWQTKREINPAAEGPFTNCDSFGDTTTLSADGSTLLVTTTEHWYSTPWTCTAFVYESRGGAWQRAGLLYPTGTTATSAPGRFACGFFGAGGSAISANGSRIVLSGSRWDPDAQKATAFFEVFERTSSGWERSARVELPEGPAGCAEYSSPMRLSISGDGDRLLFGQSECSRPNGTGGTLYWVGRVLAYHFDGSDWQLDQTIEPRDDEIHARYPQFGRYTRISEDGSTAVISSRGKQGDYYAGFGAAIVLQRDGNQWRRVARLGPQPDGAQWMIGCPAISRHGERIACISSVDSPGSSRWSGSLYIFDRGGGWAERPERTDAERIVLPDGQSGDHLGSTGWLWWDVVSMTGDGRTIAVPIASQTRLGDRYPDYRIGYTLTGPAPHASIAAPQLGGSENPPPQKSRSYALSFSKPDGADGITGFECAINDSGWDPCSSPREFTGLADGTHQFRVRAVGAGDLRSAAVTRTVVVDNAAPAAPSLGARPAPRSRDRSPVLTFTGERNASFECRLDEESWGACSSPKSYTWLTEGDHSFQVRQSDRAGNIGDSASYAWTIDITPPAAPSVNGPSGSVTEAEATFTFSGEPGGQFECRLGTTAPDTSSWSPCTSPFAAPLLSGTNYFSVRQSDDAGNTGERTTRTVSYAPPTSLPATPGPAPGPPAPAPATPGPVTAPAVPTLPPSQSPASPAGTPGLAAPAPAAALPVPATIAAAPGARPSAKAVTVETTVAAPGPGRVEVSIRRWGRPDSEPLCKARTRVSAAGETAVACRMGSATREAMRRGAQRVVIEVTFTPVGGAPISSRRTATLPRRR